jgi:ABC-type proline/glycine betaine transport system permease subunit
MTIPKLPLGEALEYVIGWAHVNLGAMFGAISAVIVTTEAALRISLLSVPPLVIIPAFAVLVWRSLGLRVGILAVVGLLLVWDLRLWLPAMETVSLVGIATALSLLVGIPIGIAMAESRSVEAVATPVLDFMQTTPSFVYLIPNVMFFGLGTVPAVLATMMFAVPPPVRMTALGLQQVRREVVEAGEAFGSSRWQLLSKIKLPLASSFILLGINQCIMMSLSMAVVASLIGARGLGTGIVRAITQVEIGQGVEAGVAIVILAIVLDRVTGGALGERVRGVWL